MTSTVPAHWYSSSTVGHYAMGKNKFWPAGIRMPVSFGAPVVRMYTGLAFEAEISNPLTSLTLAAGFAAAIAPVNDEPAAAVRGRFKTPLPAVSAGLFA